MNADGTDVVNITGLGYFDYDPVWSPDGQKIAFNRSDRGGVSDIYVMNADGTDVVNITKDGTGNYEPAWSPDGTKIAFASERGGGLAIYVMNADGTDVIRIHEHYSYSPTWGLMR